MPLLCIALAGPAQLPNDPNAPEAKPDATTPAETKPQPAGPTETERTRVEPLAQEGDCADAATKKEEAKGPNIAAITGLVGSAATVTAALGGVIVAIAQVPAPWDYWKYADDLARAEAAFRRNPDVRHINDAGRARAGLEGIENGFSDQLGVIVTSGISLATGATGLIASIVTVAGE